MEVQARGHSQAFVARLPDDHRHVRQPRDRVVRQVWGGGYTEPQTTEGRASRPSVRSASCATALSSRGPARCEELP